MSWKSIGKNDGDVQMKKVVLLAPLPPPFGGIAVWTQRMLKAELPSDWKIAVVDEKVIGNRAVFGKNTKRSFFNEIKRCFGIWKRLVETLHDRDTKIVHICIPAGIGSLFREIISATIAKIYKKKIVVHFRCTLPNMVSGWFHLKLFKLLAWLSDEFIVLNRMSAEFLLKQDSKIKYEIIPNFINDSELKVGRVCSENVETVIYVGGVIPEKGCEKIIEVAKLMPQVNFRLVGKVGIKTENLPANIFLLGEQNQQIVHEELLKADVFLFLSRFSGEGFSNALAEAMASGLPCIVSDWAANADMIEDGKGGVVLRDCTADNVIKALEFLNCQKTRQEYADFNVQKVMSEYLEQIVINRYFSCYEEIMGIKNL